MQSKDIVLFVGRVTEQMIDEFKEYQIANNKEYRIGLLIDSKNKEYESADKKDLLKKIDIMISCNTHSDASLQRNLQPLQDQIAAVTCREEASVPLYGRVVSFFPYHAVPTSESLLAASDKLIMRRRLRLYNKDISPAYMVIYDTSEETLKNIQEKIGYPLVVKPTGLAASRLVSICYHEEELKKVLTKTFRSIGRVYKENKYTREPELLVEEAMTGEMYSIDGYVNSKGKMYFCPLIHIKTGKTIGFDDFFGYQQITPTLLDKEEVERAEYVAEQAVKAVGLRSNTFHIELFNTEKGWRIIEIAARLGGFRTDLYRLSYGINHTANDILIHMPEKPVVPKKVKGYSVAMKFFAKNEGVLTKLSGIKKAQLLESFVNIKVNKKVGDKCEYAKNGGNSLFNIIMFNPSRSKLLADIRRLEQGVVIETKKHIKKDENPKQTG